ncbi:hypothetical protein Bbelb_401340 [Branchiostoma belcheri]|nr:hypothetical protein Bbelb_401340 [Branchiostoma belcheri]
MPTYKLTYFKHWGRGGVLRLLFAAGGIEFEDVRIEREQWPELKPSVNGYLTSVGESRIEVTLWHRMAAAQTLATVPQKDSYGADPYTRSGRNHDMSEESYREADSQGGRQPFYNRGGYKPSLGGWLAGKTPLEEARADMVVDGLADLEGKIVDFFIEKDEKRKQEKIKEFAEKTLPTFLGTYEKLASSGGYFVGNALTWADVDFFAMMFFLKDHLPSDPLQGYVNLTKVRDNVSSHPGIAGCLEKEGASQ